MVGTRQRGDRETVGVLLLGKLQGLGLRVELLSEGFELGEDAGRDLADLGHNFIEPIVSGFDLELEDLLRNIIVREGYFYV